MCAKLTVQPTSLPTHEHKASAFDALPMPAALLDSQGVVLTVNRAWQSCEWGTNVLRLAVPGTNLLLATSHLYPTDPIVRGIVSVVQGKQAEYQYEYPQAALPVILWYELRVTTLSDQSGFLLIHKEITQRKRTEFTLRESELRYRTAFEHTAIGMALVGTDGRWLQVNQALCNITGYTKYELLNTTFQAITHPDDRENDVARVKRALAGEVSSYQIEKRYLHKNGSTVWVQLNSMLMRDENNQPLYFISQIQDITERRLAHLALIRQTMFVQMLQVVAIAANEANSVEWAMQTTIDHICQQIGWPIGHVFLSRPQQSEQLDSTTIWHLSDPERFAPMRIATETIPQITINELPGRVLQSKKPEWITDTSSISASQRIAAINELGIRTGLAFPVMLGDEVVAVLEFFTTEDVQPDPALLEVLGHIGTQLGRVIERTRSQEAMWRSEQLYRIAANNFPNGMLLLFDPDMRYTAAGGEALKNFGLTRELIEGKTIYEVFPLKLTALLVPPHQAALAGLEHSQELVYANHTYQLYTLPVRDERGKVYAGMAIVQDITERKHFEIALMEERALLTRRVEERTADLSAANAELARAARLKDEFLASMSHELRTPLNAVLGLSEALQEQVYGMLNPTQLKTLKSIEESGRHLLDLINDILDLAKIGAGKFDLTLSPVTLNTVCQASLRLIKQEAHKKQLLITTSFDPQVDMILADARRIKQVLLNLLSNAIKFTPAGGSITLEVKGDPENQVVHITVSDTGIGIATEDMSRLFQPFVQLDSRLARQYNGTGLGLALVYRMVEMHGGSISVTSEVGKGSRFTISLPWNSQDIQSHFGPINNQALAMHKRPIRHVLIIEDSPTSAGQLARYLSELSLTATTYPQGEGAISQVLQYKPDLIVLDVLLPDTSGWEVLERLKEDTRTQQIPVLIVSVMDDRSYGLHLGATDYLVKPFNRQDVQQVLQRLQNTDSLDFGQNAPSVLSNNPLVLLAEDNETSIATTFDYLTAKGYQVVVARNGTEAIDRAHEIQPTIILMDIQMPGMDGLEAIRRIRQQPKLINIPIIALTALAMPGDRERCLSAGANEYLSKPVSLKGLTTTIEAYIRPQQGRS